MATPGQFRRFLAIAGGATLCGALACAALVVAIDPYRLYCMPERPGLNADKTQPQRYQYEIKTANARAAHAELLILGNSRAEIGLNPDDPLVAATGLSPYNLALAGTRLHTAREQLGALAAAGQHPKHVIVGVDFLDFPVDPAAPAALAPPARQSGLLAELPWRFDTLFSVDSVIDAVKTVRMQGAADALSMSDKGFNPLREYRQLAREEGYYPLFRQRAADYAKRFERMPGALVSNAGHSSREWDALGGVLEQAVRAKARIDLVIYPYHAQLLFLLEKAGKRALFDAWKALLAERLATLQRDHPTARVALWDFSGYGARQCEAIPAKGDRNTNTEWYWEGGHFKEALGHLMFARMLAPVGAVGGAPSPEGETFGFALTAANLDANNARMARERAACVAANPALFAQ